jgi:hypothetical protein
MGGGVLCVSGVEYDTVVDVCEVDRKDKEVTLKAVRDACYHLLFASMFRGRYLTREIILDVLCKIVFMNSFYRTPHLAKHTFVDAKRFMLDLLEKEPSDSNILEQTQGA